MKRIRITIEALVPDTVAGHHDPRDAAHVSLGIIRDALAEFQGSRSPVARYVEERYPADKGYDDSWRGPEKRAEVEARCLLSGALARSVKLEEIPTGFEGRALPVQARCRSCRSLITIGRLSPLTCGICASADLVPASEECAT